MSDQAAAVIATPDSVANAADDARFMRLAFTLGRRGLGNTWPNPAVGAVIVKDGVIVGRGWTQIHGRPHAEVEALRRAKKAAQGATMYVTLEPCSHQGKTPPCADAIIKAGIARVVSALEDPNPDVAGQGHARLRDKGVTVDVGLGRRRGARRSRRPHHARHASAAACDAETGGVGRRQSWARGPQAGVDHRRGGSRARVPDAGGERRHHGRHRHDLVRQSAIELPAARHVRALAGARGARRRFEIAVDDRGGGDGARNADLGVHVEQAVGDRRGNPAAQRLQGVPRRRSRRPARSEGRAQGAGRAGHHATDGGGRSEACRQFCRGRPGG